jgi:hypothetical protein
MRKRGSCLFRRKLFEGLELPLCDAKIGELPLQTSDFGAEALE